MSKVASRPNRVQKLSGKDKIDLEDLNIDKYLELSSTPQYGTSPQMKYVLVVAEGLSPAFSLLTAGTPG